MDLEKEENFRDLKKPVGILNKEREEEVRENFEQLKEMQIEPFHFGSFYSNPNIVTHYLIRRKEFSALHVKLQNGRYDVPDRLFHSVRECFQLCLNSQQSDVRELIPEFFYDSEFLLNGDNLNFGVKQNGQKVNHVLLPPWCDGKERKKKRKKEIIENRQSGALCSYEPHRAGK